MTDDNISAFPQDMEPASSADTENATALTSPTAISYNDFATSEGEWRPLVTFGGKGLDYFVLKLQNTILTILTLGIYHFWGKAKVRVYLWKETILFTEPLEYTGTGKELFISFLIIMPIFLILMVASGFLGTLAPVIGQIIVFIVLLFLWQYASYRAVRYRLTRTRWRGIRGNLAGNASSYAWKAFGYLLLGIISCGLLLPFAMARTISLKMNNVYIGNRKLTFNGDAKGLYKAIIGPLIAILIMYAGIIVGLVMLIAEMESGFGANQEALVLLFVGMIYGGILFILIVGCWIQAAILRWFCKHTHFAKMRIESVLTGGKLAKVTLTNLLLIIFTFGIGAPWAEVRMYRTICNAIDYTGDPEIESLLKNEGQAPKYGEGLLEALDVDIAF